jgi:hypothetical protein
MEEKTDHLPYSAGIRIFVIIGSSKKGIIFEIMVEVKYIPK